uniref:Transposase Tnp1/En/Spm-like domain-containing protein n=1 Tax=Oryza glumipatula TaxID=40148 RepID=A0A0D9Y8T5_9ORYZ
MERGLQIRARLRPNKGEPEKARLDGEARTAQSTGQAVHHSNLYARDNKDQRTSTRVPLVAQITFAPPPSRTSLQPSGVRPGSDRPDRILLKLSKVFASVDLGNSIPVNYYRDLDGRIKRRRGPTKLANVENLPEGVKIIVKLDRFNIPCSQSAIVLGSYLGTLVRKPHLAPLNILQWNHKLYKRVYHPKMISEVERKFAIDGRANNWILHQLDGKWRQYKSKLKKGYYKPNLPMERVLQTVSKTVAESQWATLVDYWYSEDSKKISDKNKENAQNIKHPHTLGRKSFARKRKELEVNGVEVDRATFFDECHKTKDGRYVNDATEEKMKRVDGQELSEADFEQTMLEVFGKDHSGRVRGMGPTITPTNYYGGRFSNISGSSEGSSSSNVNGFISFIVSYLAEKYPEDNLISRLPPSLARVIPRQEVDQNQGSQPPNTATSSLPFDQNHGNQLPNTTPSSSARASSQSCSEEE